MGLELGSVVGDALGLSDGDKLGALVGPAVGPNGGGVWASSTSNTKSSRSVSP